MGLGKLGFSSSGQHVSGFTGKGDCGGAAFLEDRDDAHCGPKIHCDGGGFDVPDEAICSSQTPALLPSDIQAFMGGFDPSTVAQQLKIDIQESIRVGSHTTTDTTLI